MKDSKSITLLVLSSALLLMSVILLATLGYQYYRQAHPAPVTAATPEHRVMPKQVAAYNSIDSAATRDSLIRIYNLALNNFEKTTDSPAVQLPTNDSAKASLASNLKEYYRLKDEIALLLQEKSSNADMLLAREKIAELQLKVELLTYRNSDVEKENRRLYAMLQQLTRQSSQDGVGSSTTAFVSEPRMVARPSAAAVLSASNLSLTAQADNDQETSSAEEAEKLVGSFTVKNTGAAAVSDVVVVVVQPNGQVLQKSAWESGAFETTQGKKIYSCKLKCEAGKGETKQLNFSISTDNYQKGNYQLQVYHNGILIAKKSKVIS